jgi:hypothetical protein
MATADTKQHNSINLDKSGQSDGFSSLATKSNSQNTADQTIANAQANSAADFKNNATSKECKCQVVVNSLPSDLLAFPYVPSFISAFVVITGWIVVNKAQANRERRKQIREFASGLMKDLSELEKAIIEYHTTVRDEAKEQAIIARLTRFEKSIGLLPKFVAGQLLFKAATTTSLSIPPAVIQIMRKAMTLRHFSDEHTNPVKPTDTMIQEIEIATNDVHENLEKVRLASLD